MLFTISAIFLYNGSFAKRRNPRSFGHRDMLRVEAYIIYNTRPQEKPAALYYMFLLVSNFGVAIQIALLGEQHLSGYCVFCASMNAFISMRTRFPLPL